MSTETLRSDFLERASDPSQYDNGEVDWQSEGAADSPQRLFFWRSLEPYLGDIANHKVLDIGCGSGWLAERLSGMGADVVGFDPSQQNFQEAVLRNPNALIEKVTLEQFTHPERFDLAVAGMVFEHIKDIDAAFTKIASLLREPSQFNTGGRLLTVVGDKDTFTAERPGKTVEIVELANGEAVVKATRPYGTLVDIVRPAVNYIAAAEEVGFVLKGHEALAPDDELKAEVERYRGRSEPLWHLLDFRYQGGGLYEI